MAWQKNITKTLLSATTPVTATPVTEFEWNLLLMFAINAGVVSGWELQFSNNTNTVYATRRQNDAGTDTTSTSADSVLLSAGGVSGDVKFCIMNIYSISSEEKLMIGTTCGQETAGAANLVARQETYAKYVPSPDAPINEIDYFDNSGNNYEADSNISLLSTA